MPENAKVKKQIILNCEELETRSALLHNGRLEEYEQEQIQKMMNEGGGA